MATQMSKEPDQSRPSRRNPPVNTRFKPGESGNPKGRPKGRKNLKTVLEKELARRVTVTENGKARKVTKRQVIVQRLVHDSMKGQHKATDLVLRLYRDLCGADDSEDAASTEIKQPDKATLQRIKRRLDLLFPNDDGKSGNGQ